MSPSEIKFTLQTLCQLVMRDETVKLAEIFDIPLPFYTQDAMAYVQSRDAIVQALDIYRAKLQRDSVSELRTSEIIVEDCSDLRAMAQIEWSGFDDTGKVVNTSRARCVVRTDGLTGQVRIEMVEYLKLSYPDALAPLFESSTV